MYTTIVMYLTWLYVPFLWPNPLVCSKILDNISINVFSVFINSGYFSIFIQNALYSQNCPLMIHNIIYSIEQQR